MKKESVFNAINNELIKEKRVDLIPEFYFNKEMKISSMFDNSIERRFRFCHRNIPIKIIMDNGKKSNKCGYIDWDDNNLTEEKILEIIENTDLNTLVNNSIFDNFSIHHYLNRIKDYKNMTYREIAIKSNFKEKYLESIFNIKKGKSQRKPSRNSIIGLSFAFDLSYEDANYLLTIASFNKFRVEKKRDLIILKCLQDKRDIHYLNEILDKYGLEKVGNLEESDAN